MRFLKAASLVFVVALSTATFAEESAATKAQRVKLSHDVMVSNTWKAAGCSIAVTVGLIVACRTSAFACRFGVPLAMAGWYACWQVLRSDETIRKDQDELQRLLDEDKAREEEAKKRKILEDQKAEKPETDQARPNFPRFHPISPIGPSLPARGEVLTCDGAKAKVPCNTTR